MRLAAFVLFGGIIRIALMSQNFFYPQTKKVDHVDVYHGISIPDPYRWLEDENSPEVKQWIEEQNKVTFAHLKKIPYIDDLRRKYTDLWNYPRMSVPIVKKKSKIYSYNSGLQNQNVFYYLKDAKSVPRLILDPNELSPDGTVSVSSVYLSRDGRYFGYTISRGGSDWNEAFVIDIAKGTTLTDHLKWLKFSPLTWYKHGFFYSRFDPDTTRQLSGKNLYHSVYYHQLGTSQEEDKLIFRNENEPLRTYRTQVDRNEQWLFLYEAKGTSNNALYFAPLKDIEKGFTLITPDDFEYSYTFVGNIGRKFLFLTNYGAPRYRLMIAESRNPHFRHWQEFLPEQSFVIQNVGLTKNYVVIVALENAYNKIYIYDQKGNLVSEVPLPAIGSVGSLSTSEDNDVIYFSFMNYIQPSTVYEYHIPKNLLVVWFRPDVRFDFSEYVVEQVWYHSKDGTRVPMFLTMKKGMEKNGQNRVLLYGYGGFNVSLTPRFSTSILPFLESGGIYAVANIRGGGEFGKEWHLAGTKERKQNVFDDFIAAAEYLISEGYTSPGLIGIQGGSNGGLLVAACANQRPELFGVALPAVGVMDMLRFHKFTIGWAWTGDYGCSDNPEDFAYLIKYSPIHNIREGVCYPATLVTTADHDDRVVPAHSFKYIATLQEKHACDRPVLIRIETEAGHGAGKPVSKIIEETADVIGFLMYHLGMSYSYEE